MPPPKSDNDGRFHFTGLFSGKTNALSIYAPSGVTYLPRVLANLTLDVGETRKVGEIRLNTKDVRLKR